MQRTAGLVILLVVCFSLTVTRSTPADTSQPAATRFSGARISLDVQQVDIADVLRVIAEISQLNIITSPEVQGKVTTRMVNVPWDQALDVLLKLYGLGMERHGNVLLIAPLQQVVTQQQHRLRRQQAEQQAEAVVRRIIQVQYANAEALQANLQRFLGDCATIAVDRRTNSMILTGTPSCLRLGAIPAP